MSVALPDEVRLETDDFNCDDVRITAIDGREVISQLFDFDVEVVAMKKDAVTAEDMLGATVRMVFESEGEEVRAIHGMIARVEDRLDTDVDYRTYRLRFVPRAHRLMMVELQELYLDMSLSDIIRQKLELVGLDQSVEFRLQDDYDARELVTQYRETDVAFISRLTEHVGVSFIFDHSEGEDKIVFTDNASGFLDHAEDREVPYRERGDECDVFRLKATSQVIPATYAVMDYNYRTPHVDLNSAHELEAGYAGGVIEYGTHFKTPAEGDRFARVRAEERQSTRTVYEGASDRCTFSAGSKFRLTGHGALDDTDLLLTEVVHRVSQSVERSGGRRALNYSNTFKAVPASIRYRPPRRTPRPRIHGLLNAIIDAADAPGRLAKLDSDGRYTVQFIFDTAAPGREKASRPVRMIQNHAGPGYGTHFPLKPGIEVLLAFVDGDPDRPIIVGSVPNPMTPAPVTAVNATKNQIKTRSGVVFEIDDGA
jgi:type VI secretion system secreted protein VgrG